MPRGGRVAGHANHSVAHQLAAQRPRVQVAGQQCFVLIHSIRHYNKVELLTPVVGALQFDVQQLEHRAQARLVLNDNVPQRAARQRRPVIARQRRVARRDAAGRNARVQLRRVVAERRSGGRRHLPRRRAAARTRHASRRARRAAAAVLLALSCARTLRVYAPKASVARRGRGVASCSHASIRTGTCMVFRYNPRVGAALDDARSRAWRRQSRAHCAHSVCSYVPLSV
jgi:hypothetical protein